MSQPRRTSAAPRSESVRSRRSQRSQERVRHASNNVRYQAVTPTILMRSGSYGTPVVHRTKNPVRRPVIIPLKKAGAEVELPALPVIRPGWRLLSGFLVLLLGTIITAASINPWLRITQPEISGLQRVDPADVAAVMKLADTPIFLVDQNELKETIQAAFPELTQIAIQVNLPAKVSFSAVERQPIIAWRNNDQISWLDKEGIIFPPRGESPQLLTIDSGQIPLMQTEEEAVETPAGMEKSEGAVVKRVEASLLKAALRLSEMLPAETTLAYSPDEGLGWVSPEGWKVYVGSTLEDMNDKLAMYQRIVDELNRQGISPAMISVQFLHAPFYRVE